MCSYFSLYWLVNRDPYNGLLKSPHNWVVFNPLFTLNNQGPFFHCCLHTYLTHRTTQKGPSVNPIASLGHDGRISPHEGEATCEVCRTRIFQLEKGERILGNHV